MSDTGKIKRALKLEIEEENLITTIRVMKKILMELKEKLHIIKTKNEICKK